MAIKYNGKLAAVQGHAHVVSMKAAQAFGKAVGIVGRISEDPATTEAEHAQAVADFREVQNALVAALRREADALAGDYVFTNE